MVSSTLRFPLTPSRILSIVTGLMVPAHLVEDRAEEPLLALDPPEVRGRVGDLPTVDHLDVVPGADVGEGGVGIQLDRTGLGDIQTRGRIAGRVVEVHRDAAQGVHQSEETREVDLHVVVDGDVQGLADGPDECRRPAGPERAVDSGRRTAVDGDIQIPGDGEKAGPSLTQMQDRDRVGALAGGAIAEDDVRILDVA